jgi:hypothetical protein
VGGDFGERRALGAGVVDVAGDGQILRIRPPGQPKFVSQVNESALRTRS